MPRTALVTGGASGLGAATAARLRADGLTVTTLDVSGPADVTADVTDEAALRRIAGEIGPLDVLVNSAGIVGANMSAQLAMPTVFKSVHNSLSGSVATWAFSGRAHHATQDHPVYIPRDRPWLSAQPNSSGGKPTRTAGPPGPRTGSGAAELRTRSASRALLAGLKARASFTVRRLLLVAVVCC